MSAPTEFLARLGLAPDADERQVRHAYARELKKIDQEIDLEGFQYLRDCYEVALNWVAHKDDRSKLSPCLPQAEEVVPYGPASRRPESVRLADRTAEQATPQALADAVFMAFQSRMAALTALHGVYESPAGIVTWVVPLRDALAEPSLQQLDARAAFERRVAALLCEGWRPGHHLLLPAAIEVFQWGQGPQALAHLGVPGRFLDVVLDEQAMFRSQDHETVVLQQDILAQLRRPHAAGELTSDDMAILFEFEAAFPALRRMLAPDEPVSGWRSPRQSESARLSEESDTSNTIEEDVTHSRVRRIFWTFIVCMVVGPMLLILLASLLMPSSPAVPSIR